MKIRRTLRQVAVALLLLVAFLFQGTWALAGTTGSLSGTVTDDKGAPIAGAAVKVSSPSQTASASTDASGHFSFFSLAPDTYTIAVTKDGFNPFSQGGIVVFADQAQTLAISVSSLKTIAKTTARAGSLVRAGTVSDVYAVNAASQKQTAVASGGQNLDSAYSAIYTTPGVVTSGNGNFGFGQTFYIRGSSYSQAGYEFDGVPVNRAFDNYNANSLSTLGTSQTEVYTGGSPASAGSATLAGYINQVIKTGTYPGFGTGQATIGTPEFRHGALIEAGGASPDRLFSYYVGLSGMNYIPNLINNQNGGNLNPDGSNQYGIQGYGQFAGFGSGSMLYGLNALFVGAGSDRGPWPTCNSMGGAPAGAPLMNTNALFGTPTPICNSYAPLNETVATAFQYGTGTQDRENVLNFHFGIQHKNDPGRDDIQILYDNFAYHTVGYDNIDTAGSLSLLANSFAPWAGPTGYAAQIGLAPGSYPVYGGANSQYQGTCAALATIGAFFGTPACPTTGGSPLAYGDGLQVVGVNFGASAAASANALQPYYFPSSPANRPYQSGVPANLASGVWNDGSIIKLQYQKNWSSGYARLYGYTFYSDWLQNDPNGGAGGGLGYYGIGFASSPDYELTSHTHGISLEVADQLNDKNVLTLGGNYVSSQVERWNNGQAGLSPGSAPAAMLMNAQGQCFSYTANMGKTLPLDGSYTPGLAAGSQVSCLSVLAGTTLQTVANAALPAIPAAAAAAGASWTMAANLAADANSNTVSPSFYTLSLTDDYRPTDKLDINGGVRFESYTYHLANINNPEAVFWVNQINATACVQQGTNAKTPSSDGSGGSQDPTAANTGFPTNFTTLPGQACPTDPLTGATLVHPGQGGTPLLSLGSTSAITLSTMSPRIGFTYTVNPDVVVRGSYGRYVQPTETAFEQVLTYVDGYNLATKLFNSSYYNLGFGSTVHNNPLQYSNNADLSYEQHFKGTDLSLKLSPFYRYTNNQLVTTPLPGGLAGGFNAATQQTSGLELALQKGDPSRDGWSGQLSYTYTHARVKYNEVDGVSNITNLYSTMQGFLGNGTASQPGLTATTGGSPCYSGGVGLTAAQCAATPGAITNPYYNLLPGYTYASLQSQVPLNGWYEPYANYFPYGLGSGDGSTELPDNAFAGYVAYKKSKWQAAVNFSLLEGTKYGSPNDMLGIDPRTCSQNQGAIFGNASQLADYQTCGSDVVIPNPVTGTFDNLGQYTNPWQLNIGAQISYDFSPRISGTLYLANLYNRCFGGTSTAWTGAYPPNSITCSYGINGGYLDYTPGNTAYNTAGAGFFYGQSPSDPLNGSAAYPGVYNQAFSPSAFGGLPFQAYFQLNVKL
jgi:hypothetical protein